LTATVDVVLHLTAEAATIRSHSDRFASDDSCFYRFFLIFKNLLYRLAVIASEWCYDSVRGFYILILSFVIVSADRGSTAGISLLCVCVTMWYNGASVCGINYTCIDKTADFLKLT